MEPAQVDPKDAQAVAPLLRQVRILFAALLGSVVIYVAVGVFLAQSGTAPGPVPDALVYALIATAAVTGSASFFMRSKLMPPRSELPTDLPIPWSEARRLAQGYLIAVLVGLALGESVALLGLVLTILSHEPRYGIGFAAAGSTVMLLGRPRAAELASVLTASSSR